MGMGRCVPYLLCCATSGEYLTFSGSLWHGTLPIAAGLGLLDEGPFEVCVHKGTCLLNCTLQLPGPGLGSTYVNIPEN